MGSDDPINLLPFFFKIIYYLYPNVYSVYMTRNVQGDRLVWCSECYVYTKAKAGSNMCAKCGDISDRCRCIRCGYEWVPRGGVSDDHPNYCPACKSKYFDRKPQRANAKKRRAVKV